MVEPDHDPVDGRVPPQAGQRPFQPGVLPAARHAVVAGDLGADVVGVGADQGDIAPPGAPGGGKAGQTVARQGDAGQEPVVAGGAHPRLDLVVAHGRQHRRRRRRRLRHHAEPPVPGLVVDPAGGGDAARQVGVAEVAEAEREGRGGSGEDADHLLRSGGGALVAVGGEGERARRRRRRSHRPGRAGGAVVAEAVAVGPAGLEAVDRDPVVVDRPARHGPGLGGQHPSEAVVDADVDHRVADGPVRRPRDRERRAGIGPPADAGRPRRHRGGRRPVPQHRPGRHRSVEHPHPPQELPSRQLDHHSDGTVLR